MGRIELLLGKTFEEAREILKDSSYRLVMKDKIPYIITHDLKFDRYNLYVENNIVTRVDMG